MSSLISSATQTTHVEQTIVTEEVREQHTSANALNVNQIRADFPILSRKINGQEMVFLDSAASSQKPQQVIDKLTQYYQRHHANVHRGMYTLSLEATEMYEVARRDVARFIGAPNPASIIFTRNATEAINLVAFSWGEANLSSGDEILLSELEHHANIVPWVRLKEKTGCAIRVIPITPEGTLNLSNLDNLINSRTRLVSLGKMSNALGTINPVEEIFAKAKKVGAITLCDAAQSAPHMPTNVTEIGCDFLALSAHKMLGPTGIGVLYGNLELLEQMPPFISGGEMIDRVSFDEVTYNVVPNKFEAGTPNIADAIAFSAAIEYLERIGMSAVREHEKEITTYALEKLGELDFITLYGPTSSENRGGAVSFALEDVHPHDVGQFLDCFGIAVRAGHHCAQPLMKALGVTATTRASFYIYNTLAEVDRLCEALTETRKYFRAD
jgi:cysteine desulfurase/selenocysteine lyase